MERLGADAISRILRDLDRAELGDPRRLTRAKLISARLATLPNGSLPDALVTDAELEGGYRFFGNEHITFDDLLEPHALGTVERAGDAGVVLAIHDTTSCKFAHADPRDVGYLNTGNPGFQLHLTLLVSTRDWARPLGIVHGEALRRSQRSRKTTTTGKKSSKRIEKEFARWLRGVVRTEERVGGAAAVIHIADRESDSYELMSTLAEAGQRFIFRARVDRVIIKKKGGDDHVRNFIKRADVVLEREVPLSVRLAKTAPAARRAHPPREARVAKLNFASTTVTLKRPYRGKVVAHLSKSMSVNVVHVFETDPPTGQAPVDWLLYTTEPIDTADQVATVVDYYRCRWQIEELNKALKTGCVVQERQLESYGAILNLLALSLPIAVELLALRSLARSHPDRPASTLFSKSQLAALRHISHRPLPRRPTVQDTLWCVAGLGGHIKNNGQPGWQVLQRGMEKFLAFAAGWCAHEEADL